MPQSFFVEQHAFSHICTNSAPCAYLVAVGVVFRTHKRRVSTFMHRVCSTSPTRPATKVSLSQNEGWTSRRRTSRSFTRTPGLSRRGGRSWRRRLCLDSLRTKIESRGTEVMALDSPFFLWKLTSRFFLALSCRNKSLARSGVVSFSLF